MSVQERVSKRSELGPAFPNEMCLLSAGIYLLPPSDTSPSSFACWRASKEMTGTRRGRRLGYPFPAAPQRRSPRAWSRQPQRWAFALEQLHHLSGSGFSPNLAAPRGQVPGPPEAQGRAAKLLLPATLFAQGPEVLFLSLVVYFHSITREKAQKRNSGPGWKRN